MTKAITKLIGWGALVAATTLPSMLAAQQYNPGSGVRSSPVARYSLMQLSVPSDHISYEDFSAQTSEIRSCYDAKKLAKELDAKVTRNRYVTASSLPEGVQKALKETPRGEATQVFSADGSVMRVIVICSLI